MVWIGLGLTIVFGITSLLQYLDQRAKRPNLVAIRGQLDAICSLCDDAIKSEDITSTEAGRMFVKSIVRMSMGARHSLDTLLPTKPKQ